VPEAPTLPSADHLFQKWKQLLVDGNLTTASVLAGGQPDLTFQLQLRINDYLSVRAGCLDETLTAAADSTDGPASPPALKDYTVLGALGHGGMGEVYRVRDVLDREFALKVARRGQLSAAGRARFLDEARTMARFDHPHVARVHHFGLVNDEQPYFTMRVYPASLKDRLAEYQADPEKAVRLMAAVAEGVGHLHAADLVHRDLKPHNILLDEAGRPAVSDFGLVKNVSDSSAGDPPPPGSGTGETKPTGPKRSRTVAGAAVGTRAYMAPEQAAGLTHLANPKWDVWALGVILHQLLTGEFPKSSEAPERLLDPNEPDNPAPSTVKKGIDPRLEKIICQCLSRDEASRSPDGAAVAASLRALLGRPAGRRRMHVAVVIAIAVLGCIALLAWAPWRDRIRQATDADREARLRAELIKRLQDREEVVLIDDLGRCPYGVRAIGARAGTAPIDTTAGFTATGVEMVLGELAPREAELTAFEITADVRFLQPGERRSLAGVYYAHNPSVGADALDHTFAYFGFREFAPEFADQGKKLNLGPDQMTGYYTLGMDHWVRPDVSRLRLGGIIMSPTGVFATPLAEKADRPYRRIRLRVTPETVTVTFQDQDVGTQRHDRMSQQWAGIRGAQLPRAGFGPAGGIGVYLFNGTVSVRNFRVQALP
jgi:hypothetical protein